MQLWHFLICDIAQQTQKGKSCPMRREGSSTHPPRAVGKRQDLQWDLREKYEKGPNTEKSHTLQWEIWEAKYFQLHLTDT